MPHTERLEGTFELREATTEDCELMFRLQKLDGSELNFSDAEQAAQFEEYKNNFNPTEIQVIYVDGLPVGRLRVVTEQDIYIGGMQILPEYRGRGLGTSILGDFIKESKRTLKPIRLEVFHDNQKAFNLYKEVGFKVFEENDQQKIMVYQPT